MSNLNKKLIITASLLGILLLANILAIPAILSLKNLVTDYNSEQSLPRNNSILLEEKKLKKLFQLEKTPPLFALIRLNAEERGSWLASDRLKKLRTATNEISSLEGVLEVLSITEVQVLRSLSADSQLQLLSITDSLEPKGVGEIDTLFSGMEERAEWRTNVAKHPIVSPRLISQDERSVAISIHQEVVSKHGTKKLKDEIKKILKEKFPYTTVQIGGQPAIQLEISSLLSKELTIFFCLSILIIGFTLFLIFNNISGFLVPLYITVMANIASLSWISHMGIPFTVLSSSLPILINITVVSMCIHTMIRFTQEYLKNSATSGFDRKWKAMKSTQKALFLPNMLTSLTTCVGFFTLYVADVLMISQYSTTVCFGIMISWLASNTLLIPILLLAKAPSVRPWTRKGARWSIHVMRNARPIFVSLTALLVVMFITSNEKNWTALLMDSVPKNKESKMASDFIDKNMGASIPLSLIIDAKKKYAWNSEINIKKKNELIQKWRKQGNVGSIISLVDLLEMAHNGMESDKNRNTRLPASRSAISEIYFLYSLHTKSMIDKFMSGEGRYARISILLNDIPDKELTSIVGSLKEDAKKMFPNYDIKATDMAATVHPINRKMSLMLINSFWMSILLISCLLLFVFRSLRLVLLAAIPNLFPPLILLSTMYLFGVAMRPGIAIIFAIAIGLAFNNTTYLIGRLKTFIQNRKSSKNLINRTLYLEGTTCFLSTLPLIAGFVVFLFSEFEINRLFGTYMFLSILAGLVGDLLFLPSILKTFPRIIEPLIQNSEKTMSSPKTTPFKQLLPIQRFIVSFILAFIFINVFHEKTFSANKVMDSKVKIAKKILNSVDRKLKTDNEKAVIAMETKDKNGNKKSSTLKIWRKHRSKSNKVLIEIIKPNDNRGIKLLSIDEKSSRSQWIFLPSSNRMRRIVSKGQGQGFMGSELSYEDLGGFSNRFKSKLEKKIAKGKKKYAIIESTPVKNSSYSKVRIWVSMPEHLIQQIKYYDKKNRLLKVSRFFDYKLFEKKVWRATKMVTTNVQNKRTTKVDVRKLAVLNKEIPDQIFSLSNLEEN